MLMESKLKSDVLNNSFCMVQEILMTVAFLLLIVTYTQLSNNDNGKTFYHESLLGI